MTQEPTYNTSIRLYLRDVEEMERIFGYGWSGQIREIIHRYLRERRQRLQHYQEADND